MFWLIAITRQRLRRSFLLPTARYFLSLLFFIRVFIGAAGQGCRIFTKKRLIKIERAIVIALINQYRSAWRHRRQQRRERIRATRLNDGADAVLLENVIYH